MNSFKKESKENETTFHQEKTIQSQHVQKYNNFFFYQNEGIQKNRFQKNIVLEKLKENQLIFIRESDSKNKKNLFSVFEIKSTNSPQIYQIYVNIGQFFSKLTLLIVPSQFQIKSQDIFDQGSNGIISLSYNLETSEYFVIKYFKINLSQQFGDNLLFILNEYMIALVMSELQIGPKLTKDFGFDIILYLNCVQFTMQLCSPKKHTQIQILQKTLKQSLLKMHALNIVHLDIKPQNILYSHSFSKYVFIDFGYSKLITENFGQKSFIQGYIGTYYYSHQEMQECLNKPNYVDLYYNDAYCLNKTIDKLQMSNKMICQLNLTQEQQKNLISVDHFLLHNTKYYAYAENKIKIQKYIKMIQAQNDILEINRFFSNFVPNSFFQSLFSDQKFHMLINKQNNSKISQNFIKFVKFQFKNLDEEPDQEKIKQKANDCQQVRINKLIKNIKILLFDLFHYRQSQSRYESKNLINFNQLNAKKKFIFGQNNIDFKCQKSRQTYFQLVFDFVTFQQSYYQASFEEKSLILDKFMTNLEINAQMYIDYLLNQPKLRKFVVFTKYLLIYCETQPYTEVKKRLFPKLCLQFTLINSEIFTQRHTFNYLQGWFKTVFEQNKQNFLQMIVKLNKIRFASRLIQYRNDQIFFQKSQNRQVYNCLSFLRTDRKYLLKELGSQKVIDQFLQVMRLVQKSQVQIENFEFLELRLVVTQNEKLSKQSKIILLNEIRMSQILAMKEYNQSKSYNQYFAQHLYSRINSKALNQQTFLLCSYFESRFSFFNCKTLLQNIDSIINCPQISLNYLGRTRAYTYLYLGNQKKAIQIYESICNKFKGNFLISNSYVTWLILFQNILRNQIQKQFYNDITSKYVLQKFLLITNNIVPKIIKGIKNLCQEILSQKSQITHIMYMNLFFILRQCINSLRTTLQNKQVFFNTFQKFYPLIQKSFKQNNKSLMPSLNSLKINQFCIRMIDSKKQLQLVHVLKENLEKINLESDSSLKQNFIEILYFIKTFFKGVKKKKFNYLSQYVDLQNLYEKILLRIFDYLIKIQEFLQCLAHDSPCRQILIYFLERDQYSKFLKYVEAMTNFINNNPNSVYVSVFMGSISQVQYILLFQKIQIRDKISTQLFEYLKIHETLSNSKNPYFFMVVNELLSWSWINQFNIRIKILKCIALSINSLIFKAKQLVNQKYYSNYIHAINCRQKQNIKLNNNFNKMSQTAIRKQKYLWRKHFKMAKTRKTNLKTMYNLEIGQNIKLEKKYPVYHKQLFRKFVKFHQNLDNILI